MPKDSQDEIIYLGSSIIQCTQLMKKHGTTFTTWKREKKCSKKFYLKKKKKKT